MNYLFTSESVSEGHPDKVADQISDAILDEFLRQDPEAKVACESFCSTGMVVVMGEVKAEAYVDIQTTVRDTIRRIGYTKAEYMFDASSCGVLSALHEQSADINRGVERAQAEDQGAGDQGMMFGYACCDTEDYMPLPLYLSHRLLQILSDIRHQEPALMPYLRPDAKSQFTIEYDGETHLPVKVHTIVLSTQHDEFVPASLGHMSYEDAVRQYGQAKVDLEMQAKIRYDVEKILLPRLKASLPEETARLQAYARQTGLDTLAGAINRICNRYLGTAFSWTADVDPMTVEALLEHLFERGNFGRKLGTDRPVEAVSLSIREQGLFPYLQSMGLLHWEAARRHAFLRPFAWMHTICRYAGKGTKLLFHAPGSVQDQFSGGMKINELLRRLDLD